MLRTALVVVVIFASACSKQADAPATGTGPVAAATPTKSAKDPATARKLIAAGAVVIDVRSVEEYSKEHLAQAPNIPVTEFASRIGEVDKMVGGDKSKPVVVYCGSGHRAATAKAQLEAAGYSNVVNGAGYDDLR
jgi:phage shock protein E